MQKELKRKKKYMLLFRVKIRVVASTAFKQNDVEQGFTFFKTMTKICLEFLFLLIRYAKYAKEKKIMLLFRVKTRVVASGDRSNKMMLNKVLANTDLTR